MWLQTLINRTIKRNHMTKNDRASLFTLVLFGLVLPCVTWAQTPDADDKDIVSAITLDERIVRSTRGSQVNPNVSATLGLTIPAAETPITTATISEELNINQGNATLRDGLRNVSGVNVGAGNGVHDFFVLRGVDSLNGGLILTDGVPEPEAGFYPMHNIAEVQVIKGPANNLHGANALAGSVNMLRKQPIADTFAEFRFGIGSHDTYKATVDAGTGNAEKTVAARVNGLFMDGESHRDQVEQRFIAINPSFAWTIDENSELIIHFDYQDSEVSPDAGVPLLGPTRFTDSRSANFGHSDDFSNQEIIRLMAAYEHRLSDNVTLRNKAYYTDFDWSSKGTVYAGFILFGAGVEASPDVLSRFRPSLEDEQEIFGDELELAIASDTRFGENEIVIGGEFTQYKDTFLLSTPSADDLSVSTGLTFPNVTLPAVPDNAGDAETEIWGAYLADHLKVNEDLTLTAGGRVELMDFEDSSRGTSKSETLVSPFGGLTFELTDDLALYANGSIGFAPPSTQVRGPRGAAEEGRAVEGGIRFTCPITGWQGNVAVYQLERDNIAVPTSSGLNAESGSQTSQGVDVDLGGNLTDDLSVRIAYGFLDSELDSFSEFSAFGIADRGGNDAPFAPEHILQVWSEYELDEHWMIGLGGRAVSEQFVAPDNAYEIDTYVSVDAALIYRQPTWDISIHLKNITDEEIDSRGIGNTSVTPEDEFNVMAYLGIRL
jgi:iron complex outermembrane receptor protein